MIGIELQDTRVVAVAVGDRGAVQARTMISGAGLATAATAAVEQVAAASGGVDRIGIASLCDNAQTVAATLAALAKRHGAALGSAAPTMSGTAAAVGEAWVGAARGATDVAFFAASEHTTGGVIRNGLPVLGAHGRAGSVAWLALNPVEREDYRKTGCVEAEVAAAGIVRRLIWRIKAGDRSRVQDQVSNDLTAITIDHVLDAARGGDGVSISVVRDTAKYLGMAAANIAAIADPEVLVLGGVMASAQDLLLEPVRTEIARRLSKAMIETLTIVPATLGADAAAIGAARIAMQA